MSQSPFSHLAVQDQEHLVQLLFQSKFEAILWVDPEGHCRYANQTCLNLLCYRNIEELVGKDIKTILHRQPRRAFREFMEGATYCQTSALREAQEGEDQILWRKDGEPLQVRLAASPFFISGKSAGTIFTFIDITWRTRVEEQNSLIIEVSPDAFWIVDQMGYLLSVNEATCKMLGYSRAEITGMHISDIDVLDRPEDVLARIEAIKQHGSVKFTTKHKTKDGILIDVEVTVSAFKTPEGDFRCFGFLRDISDRLAAERVINEHRGELERLVEMRTRSLEKREEEIRQYAMVQTTLLREINHRVKNNLFAILGMINSQKIQLGTQGEEIFTGLERRVFALAAVHDLLSMSEWKPIRLSDLCLKILAGVSLAGKGERSIDYTVSPSGVTLPSRQAHLAALLINELAVNSAKYGSGPDNFVSVEITIRQPDENCVTILFKDNGPGFVEEVLAGSFQPKGIGLEIVGETVRKGLEGEMMLRNDNGAVVEIVFAAENQSHQEAPG